MGEALDRLIEREYEATTTRELDEAYSEYKDSDEAKEYFQRTGGMCHGACRTSPICDNCYWFWFSLNWCGHPEHPGEEFPHHLCDDYDCQFLKDKVGYVMPPWWWRGYVYLVELYYLLKWKLTKLIRRKR